MTCTDRVNAVRHARKFDYTPRRRSATQVGLTFTLAAAAAGDVTLRQGDTIRSKSVVNAVAVQIMTDTIVTAGNLVGTVTAENSERHTESYTPTTQLLQRLPLSYGPLVAIDTFTDSVSSAWAEVTTWRNSGPNDAHYRVLLNSDMEPTIEFGNGTKGRLPVGQVDITYRSGGGEVAISAGQMTVPEFTLVDNLGNSVQFLVTNPLDGTTGLAEETVAELKENVPASNRSRTSTTALEDYTINAKAVDGVARAILMTSDQDSSMPENTGYLYIVGQGSRHYTSGPYAPATPSQAVLDAVELMITTTRPKTVTFRLYVMAYVQQLFNITARVKLSPGQNPATVDTAIRRSLWGFFAPTNADGTENTQVDFGYNYRDVDNNLDNYLAWSDMFNAVRDATGVRSVDRDTFVPVDDVLVTLNAFPVLGTVTLINDATGLALV